MRRRRTKNEEEEEIEAVPAGCSCSRQLDLTAAGYLLPRPRLDICYHHRRIPASAARHRTPATAATAGYLLLPPPDTCFCRLGCIVYEWLDLQWLKKYYRFEFDHFGISWRELGFTGLVDLLLGNTGPFAFGDWILPDLTIQGSLRLNLNLKSFPNTYYFSYAMKRTKKVLGFTIPSSLLGIHPLFFIRVLQMCRWRYPAVAALLYKGYRDEDWEDNDGALNMISKTYPWLLVEHPSHLVVKTQECHPLRPGIWYYKIVKADHIFFAGSTSY